MIDPTDDNAKWKIGDGEHSLRMTAKKSQPDTVLVNIGRAYALMTADQLIQAMQAVRKNETALRELDGTIEAQS